MNGFPERILLATDGLENTTLAARAAADLAKAGGAALGTRLAHCPLSSLRLRHKERTRRCWA